MKTKQKPDDQPHFQGHQFAHLDPDFEGWERSHRDPDGRPITLKRRHLRDDKCIREVDLAREVGFDKVER